MKYRLNKMLIHHLERLAWLPVLWCGAISLIQFYKQRNDVETVHDILPFWKKANTHTIYISICMGSLWRMHKKLTMVVSRRGSGGQSNKNKRERAYFLLFFFFNNLGCLIWACTTYLKSKNHTSPKPRCQGSWLSITYNRWFSGNTS